jgi:hypothetical protein
VTIRVYMKAARSPPRSEPAKSQDFRPRAMPRSARSAALFVRQIRQDRQAEIDAFLGVALGLSVQGLMLAARHCPRTNGGQRLALEQHHGQEVGPRPAPRHRIERGRRLADLLAIPAGDLLADGLDDLPLPGNDL